MTNRRRWRVIAALAACALAACTTAPLRPFSGVPALTDEPFEIAGRLSARQGTQGAAANFRWTHRPGSDELTFASPLGSTLAKLDGTPAGVRMEMPDGQVLVAADWEALTTRMMGAPIPVRGLAWWVRGAAHPGSAHRVELDTGGRASVLRQDGWEIVYGYGDAMQRPARVVLTYPDTEVRLVIDAWSDAH